MPGVGLILAIDNCGALLGVGQASDASVGLPPLAQMQRKIAVENPHWGFGLHYEPTRDLLCFLRMH